MNRIIAIAVVALCLFGTGPVHAADDIGRRVSPAVPPPPSPFAAFGPDCEIAPANPDHLFVVAAVNRGDTLTNLQLAEPNGETTLVRIVVAAGLQPITVLLQAENPVVWDFEGAIERVARAIVVPASRNRAAVRGLAAERVEFAKLARCPAQSIPFKRDSDPRRDWILQSLFGRAPDRIAFADEPNSIALPDLQPGFPPKGGPTRTAETEAEKDLLTYYPGGFRIVDAKSLLSPVEVLTPETYPVEAGLVQLERAGNIRTARRDEVDRFDEGLSKPFQSRLDPNFRFRRGFSYVVLRDIMFPPGLGGAHAKSFLVMPGVPAPRGNVGHGCLAFMDGFRADDRACYGDAWDAIETLKKLPEGDATKACRLFEAPEDAFVEAVSIYQPKESRHSSGSRRIPSPVDVSVKRPGKVVLALNTYEPAIWRVSAGTATEIVGVVLTGYYGSKVEGIPPAVPVIQLAYEGRASRPPFDPACAALHGYLGTNIRGGPGAMVFDRQIRALTGKGIDRIRGDYGLAAVEIP